MNRINVRWLGKSGVLVCLALAACTSDPFQRIYEAIRNRNEALKTPAERASSPRMPSYDAYKKERERMQHDDTQKVPEQ